LICYLFRALVKLLLVLQILSLKLAVRHLKEIGLLSALNLTKNAKASAVVRVAMKDFLRIQNFINHRTHGI
jgi:hypothetical protein